MQVDIEPYDSGFKICSKVIAALLPKTDDTRQLSFVNQFARATWRCKTRQDVIDLAKEYVVLNFVEKPDA